MLSGKEELCVIEMFEKEVSVSVRTVSCFTCCLHWILVQSRPGPSACRRGSFPGTFQAGFFHLCPHFIAPCRGYVRLSVSASAQSCLSSKWRYSFGWKWVAEGVTIGLLCWELSSFPCVSSRGPCDRLSFRSCLPVQPLTLLEGKRVPQCPIHDIQMSVCVNVCHSRGMTIPWQPIIQLF